MGKTNRKTGMRIDVAKVVRRRTVLCDGNDVGIPNATMTIK